MKRGTAEQDWGRAGQGRTIQGRAEFGRGKLGRAEFGRGELGRAAPSVICGGGLTVHVGESMDDGVAAF